MSVHEHGWPRPPGVAGTEGASSAYGVGDEPSSLAADLFLIMIHEATGELQVHPRVAGYALAAALLTELWWERRIVIDGSRVTVTLDRPLPEDAVLRRTLGWLLVEPERVDVAEWLDAVASTALDLVAVEVERSGWIRRTTRRRGGVRFEPVERSRVFWRPGRLFAALARDPSWPDLFLFALVDVVGLGPGLATQAAYRPSPSQIQTLSASFQQSVPVVVELVNLVRKVADRVAVAPR